MKEAKDDESPSSVLEVVSVMFILICDSNFTIIYVYFVLGMHKVVSILHVCVYWCVFMHKVMFVQFVSKQKFKYR